MVSITPTDPGQLFGYGASHLTESPGHAPVPTLVIGFQSFGSRPH
jgi:hypothetical protein